MSVSRETRLEKQRDVTEKLLQNQYKKFSTGNNAKEVKYGQCRYK